MNLSRTNIGSIATSPRSQPMDLELSDPGLHQASQEGREGHGGARLLRGRHLLYIEDVIRWENDMKGR